VYLIHSAVLCCVAKGSDPASMPSWMENLNRKLSLSSSPLNVRLFIARLILNAEQVTDVIAMLHLGNNERPCQLTTSCHVYHWFTFHSHHSLAYLS